MTDAKSTRQPPGKADRGQRISLARKAAFLAGLALLVATAMLGRHGMLIADAKLLLADALCVVPLPLAERDCSCTGNTGAGRDCPPAQPQRDDATGLEEVLWRRAASLLIEFLRLDRWLPVAASTLEA